MMELLYGGGLRVSELVGLNYGQIDFERGYARVLGKGNKERLCPLGRVAMAVLTKWRGEFARDTSPGAPVIVNARHQRLPVRQVQLRLKKYLALADLPAGPDAAQAPAFLRHPPAQRGRRPAARAGAARARQPGHDADLHPCQRRPPEEDLRSRPPAGVKKPAAALRRARDESDFAGRHRPRRHSGLTLILETPFGAVRRPRPTTADSPSAVVGRHRRMPPFRSYAFRSACRAASATPPTLTSETLSGAVRPPSHKASASRGNRALQFTYGGGSSVIGSAFACQIRSQ